MSFHVHVDPTNPGQFFACCGLFELATRLDRDALARFETGRFVVEGAISLAAIIDTLTHGPLRQLDDNDKTSSPIGLPPPFDLRLDWWQADLIGRELKVWAGTMQSVRIAQAMVTALRAEGIVNEAILDHGCIVYDPCDASKKVEPFYFDARRALNSHSRDVGFSTNDLELTTIAFPATEALCLIGLQRVRPARTERRRVFDYRTWSTPVPLPIASVVACGAVPLAGTRTYRFECWFRTGQKKHKAFRPAISLNEGEG